MRKIPPIDPRVMVRICHGLAIDLWAEHQRGDPPIELATQGGSEQRSISRKDASRRMIEQAKRWQHEVDTGELNMHDRHLMQVQPGEQRRTVPYVEYIRKRVDKRAD